LHISLTKDIEKIIEISKQFPLQLLAVGGFVRDSLLNRKAKDIDFLVIASKITIFEDFTKIIREEFKLNAIRPSTFDSVLRLVSKKHCFDFVFVTEDKLETNLTERDFSINTLAYNFTKSKLIDICNGKKDLDNKIIRQTFESVFKDDPVRILRMYRLETELDFDIDNATKDNANKYSHLIKNPSSERVQEEFFKILKNDDGFKATKQIFDKLIFNMFKEFKSIKNINQNGYHHLNVIDHTISVVSYSFKIEKLKSYYENFNINISKNDKIALRLAAIFHDIGKAKTVIKNFEKELQTKLNRIEQITILEENFDQI